MFLLFRGVLFADAMPLQMASSALKGVMGDKRPIHCLLSSFPPFLLFAQDEGGRTELAKKLSCDELKVTRTRVHVHARVDA